MATPNPLTKKKWILFTTYGWFIGVISVVGLAIVTELWITPDEESGGQAVVGIGMGAGVGFMQWLAIRHLVHDSRKYFWFTLAGFSFSFAMMDLLVNWMDSGLKIKITSEAALPVTVFLGAISCGWLQYKYLFRNKIKDALRWIFFLVAGWLLATFVTMSPFLFNINFGEYMPKFFRVMTAILFLLTGGPVLGWITGLFLVPRLKSDLASSG